jgi:hypothetical protein
MEAGVPASVLKIETTLITFIKNSMPSDLVSYKSGNYS